MRRFATALLLTTLLAAPAAAGDKEQEVYGKAVKWLLGKQHANGGWGQIPGQPPGEVGITTLVVKAMAEVQGNHRPIALAAAKKAMAFVLQHQQKDGSFTQKRSGLSTYRTSMAISAMVAMDRTKYQAQIERAVKWLKDDQFDKQEGVDPKNPHYGGFGYDKGGAKPDADMSNTLMALAALKDAGIKKDDPVFKKALTFLSRCQNNSETNPGIKGLTPKDDGGFIYDPGLSRNKSAETKNEDGTSSFESYASMTYGGLMSLFHSGVQKRDPRIKAALSWIKNNYTLDENYGLGIRQKDPKAAQQGLYYYYHVFAKCLGTLGTKTIKTKSGDRYWAKDLFAALAARQHKDGMFVNPNDRWWERDPTLVTAYVLNAMNYALPYLPDAKPTSRGTKGN